MSNAIPAIEYATDTVALILRLEKRATGGAARQVFADAERGEASLYIPAMVVAEIMYLAQRGRIETTLDDVYNDLQQHPSCSEATLSFAVVTVADGIDDIPELHDRLIAATAIHLGAPLVTNDTTIRASAALETVW